ncbi:hypothetical protein KHS38_20480 [Mucilaginibacter sp. Bleaf8]|uniref:hypothetical protein n=1 Tax=Mucilaginibacter sp. Bleaf8 TaxID=2834430 RepID=UPI001BCF1B66|nr:hypothetical protein [Mucilaginibacter sp. Bleaf8]MBS7566794.1 hypothetical protein [Mucilaginibacter sp. Bleaf8]
MKEPDENKLDKLFRDGFAGSEKRVAFREEDWAAMEKLLDKKSGKRAGAYRFIYYASGIAAVLLLVLGLYFFNGKQQHTDNRQQKLTKNSPYKPKKHNDQSGQVSHHPVSGPLVKPEQLVNRSSRKSKSFFPLSAARKGRYPDAKQDLLIQETVAQTPDSMIAPPTAILAENQTQTDRAPDSAIDTGNTATAPIETANPLDKKTKSIKPYLRNKPQFTLSILAAPDLNNTGSFAGGQVGTNVGIQLGLQLTKRFSIATGFGYAAKPYRASGFAYSNAFQPPVPPTSIAANCKVLDIPVNVNYQLYAKGRDAITVGTGLSSYLMLREHYRFDYDNTPGLAPFRLDIANQNQHWFGVLNINATYQRRINSKFSAVAQPYLKLPLTGIGNGNVNLRSAGVALGVSWNINTFGKPK